LIKFLKLSLNNICILFKGKIEILSFIGFLEFPVNIKLSLLFCNEKEERLSVRHKNYVNTILELVL
jgi:hypothetical protein